jgi:hypothetical protein
MTLDELHDGFRLFIRQLLSLPENSVRIADQNAPVGNEPFISVKFSTLNNTGQDFHTYAPILESNQITEIAIGQRRLFVSLQFFKGAALNQASRLKTLLTMGRASTKLQTLGLGFVSSSDVRDLSAPDDTYFESRSQIDLVFNLIAKETDTVDTIGIVPIELQTEDILTISEVYEP